MVGRAVHPHARGDDSTARSAAKGGAGSPPRAWGRRALLALQHRHERFTPTRVGTTPRSAPPAPAWAVHPHARGDDVIRPISKRAASGSPPRAWGRRCHQCQGRLRYRFTPTRVGTTFGRRPWGTCWAVHPHARGDDSGITAIDDTFRGSPPRAWGRRLRPGGTQRDRRFTPTRVGTTCLMAYYGSRGSVHPHARGDDVTESVASTTARGSPPRAWGRLVQAFPFIPSLRFTPTRVGTTLREHPGR